MSLPPRFLPNLAYTNYMKIFLGIAALLLTTAVIWTVVTIFRHPKTDPIVNNATPTVTVQPSTTPTPIPSATKTPNNTATGATTPRNANTDNGTARAKSAPRAVHAETYNYSGNITTTITTEVIDEWGNRTVETRTETASW